MDYISFNMHIMWYESQMVWETLDSIADAMKYSSIPVRVRLCYNKQTYIESPTGSVDDMISRFNTHPLTKSSEIIVKDMSDPFYNIADWRRDVHDPDAKYTVWGESDCLLPEDFFYILSSTDIDIPHILTFASRKMWDSSWDCVEHPTVQQYARNKQIYSAPYPLNSCDHINQEQLNEFNCLYPIEIIRVTPCKIDGSLLSLSRGIANNFIPDDMHFVMEDTCAETYFNIKNIPQYHVTTRIKGHNYGHPLKRTDTDSQRNSEVYMSYKEQSIEAAQKYLHTLAN